jgi:hypothetical protein
VIGFDGIVRILLGDVAGGGQQLIEHPGVGRCPVGAYLARARAMGEGPGEEPAGGRQVPLLGHQHVDELPELVDRAGEIDPSPGELDLRFLEEPPISDHVRTGSCRVDEQPG